MDTYLYIIAFPEQSGRQNLDLLIPDCVKNQQESAQPKAGMDTYLCIISYPKLSSRQNLGLLMPVCVTNQKESMRRKAVMDTYNTYTSCHFSRKTVGRICILDACLFQNQQGSVKHLSVMALPIVPMHRLISQTRW